MSNVKEIADYKQYIYQYQDYGCWLSDKCQNCAFDDCKIDKAKTTQDYKLIRQKAIELYNLGLNGMQIGEILNTHNTTIYDYIKQYKKQNSQAVNA